MNNRWLEDRRDGREQSDEEIAAFIQALVNGEVTRAQAAAWLAFVYCRGMTAEETVALTLAMTRSGPTLSWPGLAGPFVDKHSTGGVGDKVSLILAPLWAVLGYRVPMISGRGLGITGGTLDKLESIPGFRTDLSADEMSRSLETVGCFISGQTSEIAPADRILYALRNETQTVPSIPLITASILSKKLVEGLDHLVLDVKYGSGAFMPDRESAQELADSLVRVGSGAGVKTRAVLSSMEQPLGREVGNALEVKEAIECLQGGGPADLRRLVVELSGRGEEAEQALDDGRAGRKFQEMVVVQGGNLQELQWEGCESWTLTASRQGRVSRCQAGQIGQAAFLVGAGRSHEGQAIDFGVGVRLHAKVGDFVEEGQSLAVLFHRGRGLDEAKLCLQQAYHLEP
ncbi:MAG: thymidine phosphorylase [Planctomycetota bacterium]|nr:MAG: thymidine phosphorylase [Planctomycetota bacterium]